MSDESKPKPKLRRLSDAEVLEQIGNAAWERRVELAPQDRVEALRPEIDTILEAFGQSGALVTDESYVSDFPLTDEQIVVISEKLGVGFERRGTSLVDLALLLRRKSRA